MRIVFMGSSDLSAVMLKMLLESNTVQIVGAITQPDRPVGRKHKMTPCPCKAFIDTVGIPCLTPEKVNRPETLVQISAWLPDIIVVVAYGQFLCKELLNIPPKGCVNIHLSLLPRFRGASPIHSSILSGDTETGATAMLMDEGMDSGPILEIAKTPILSTDSCEELNEKLGILGGQLLIDVLPKWFNNEITPQPQIASLATVTYKIRKTDGLLHWEDSTEKSTRKIRAFSIWPSCYTFMPEDSEKDPGKMIKILKATAWQTSAEDDTQKPGTILAITKKCLIVKTGDAALAITEVQPEGGKPMTIAAFINGRPLKTGQTFYTPQAPAPARPTAFRRSIN